MNYHHYNSLNFHLTNIMYPYIVTLIQNLGGYQMNNSARVYNSLMNSEAIIASFIGLSIIIRSPVVCGSALRL